MEQKKKRTWGDFLATIGEMAAFTASPRISKRPTAVVPPSDVQSSVGGRPMTVDDLKIIGPLSIRQFFIILIGLFIGLLAYRIADLELFIVLAVLDACITGIFAFVAPRKRNL